MANLVIKSNTASNAFSVQQKSFKLPFEKDRVELLITPKKSRLINAKDFQAGLLPNRVSKVEFQNLGTKIVATVFLHPNTTVNKNVIIDVPIHGISTVKKDIFNIIKTVSVLGNVLTSGTSSYPKSVIGDKTSYIIKNNLGEKIPVFSETFMVIDSFNFSKKPTYSISGNANRYTVTTDIKKNSKNKITNITFNFYYTSPKKLTASQDTTISFYAYANDPSLEVSDAVATTERENKIYSVNQGIEPGPQGGQKRMVVKGVPGSTFGFLVSNSDGEMYDINTGSFSASGAIIKGIIPTARDGKPFGEAIIRINIPRTTGAQSISTSFIKQEDTIVSSKKIEKAINEAVSKGTDVISAVATQTTPDDKVKAIVSLTPPHLEFLVLMGDFKGSKVKIDISGVTTTSENIFLGKEGKETLKVTTPGVYDFKFTIRANGGLAQVIRSPLFVMPGEVGVDNFVTAGGTTAQKLAKLNAAGTAIVSDWDWGAVKENANVKVKITSRGIGEAISTTDVTATGAGSATTLSNFSEVVVSGQISVGHVGQTLDTVTLNLANFLAKV